MLQWIRDKPLCEKKFSPEDLDLVTITASVEEACAAVLRQRSKARQREEADGRQATGAVRRAAGPSSGSRTGPRPDAGAAG